MFWCERECKIKCAWYFQCTFNVRTSWVSPWISHSSGELSTQRRLVQFWCSSDEEAGGECLISQDESDLYQGISFSFMKTLRNSRQSRGYKKEMWEFILDFALSWSQNVFSWWIIRIDSKVDHVCKWHITRSKYKHVLSRVFFCAMFNHKVMCIHFCTSGPWSFFSKRIQLS